MTRRRCPTESRPNGRPRSASSRRPVARIWSRSHAPSTSAGVPLGFQSSSWARSPTRAPGATLSVPLSGASWPASTLSSVDFPAPFAPRNSRRPWAPSRIGASDGWVTRPCTAIPSASSRIASPVSAGSGAVKVSGSGGAGPRSRRRSSMRRWSSRTELAARLSRPCLAAPLPGCRVARSCGASGDQLLRELAFGVETRGIPSAPFAQRPGARLAVCGGSLRRTGCHRRRVLGRGRRSPSRPRRAATDRASRTRRSPETRAATAQAGPVTRRRGGCSARRAARRRPGRPVRSRAAGRDSAGRPRGRPAPARRGTAHRRRPALPPVGARRPTRRSARRGRARLRSARRRPLRPRRCQMQPR